MSKTKIKKPSKKLTENNLNVKQELFCQLFATEKEFMGNGVQSYIEAYDINTSKPGAYNAARSSAHNLLTNTDICARITELIDENGFNDQNVDKQLLFALTQCADISSKVAAIREYNKLKKRVVERMEHTGADGKPIETRTMDARQSLLDKLNGKIVAGEKSGDNK